MSRLCRLDWPGAVQHVMARGVAGRSIFDDADDRRFFLAKLAELVRETGLSIMAWALMDNHVHLLAKTGQAPLSLFMQRLLTAHAVRFNRKYDRKGHLFQNRFKSILVQEDLYLMQLVRYIHRNPVEAGLVRNVEDLGTYPWCGHRDLISVDPPAWLAHREVLEAFSVTSGDARIAYLTFMKTPVGKVHALLETGNFRLSRAGLSPIRPGDASKREATGYAILGSREFCRSILDRLKGTRGLQRRSRGGQHAVVRRILQLIESEFRMVPGSLRGARHTQGIVMAREVACFALVQQCGLSHIDAAGILGKSRTFVRMALDRMRARMQQGDFIGEHVLKKIEQIIGHE